MTTSTSTPGLTSSANSTPTSTLLLTLYPHHVYKDSDILAFGLCLSLCFDDFENYDTLLSYPFDLKDLGFLPYDLFSKDLSGMHGSSSD